MCFLHFFVNSSSNGKENTKRRTKHELSPSSLVGRAMPPVRRQSPLKVMRQNAPKPLITKAAKATTISANVGSKETELRMRLRSCARRCVAHTQDATDTHGRTRCDPNGVSAVQAVQARANAFPKVLHARIVHPATQSAYCKVSGSSTGGAFSIDASASERSVSGTIDGYFDCGKKVWGEIDIQGTLNGNIAMVQFQPGFSMPQKPLAEALIVVSREFVYWRVLSEIDVESYVPDSQDIPVQISTP